MDRALRMQEGSVLAREVTRLRAIERRARDLAAAPFTREAATARYILTGETR